MKLPYFDNAEIPHDSRHDKISDADRAAAAISAFLTLTATDRLADSRHVWAYYRDYYEIVGGQDWLDAEMGVPAGPEDIWRHVHPREIYLDVGPSGDPACYVVVSCDCDWEEEHGLALVWRDGQRLTKAGADDGWPTNGGVFDPAGYSDVVYSPSSPEWLTRLDETR